jgi:hypothetical protein
MLRRMLHGLTAFVLAATITTGLVSSARAALYDAPSIQVVKATPSYVTVKVTAGPSGAPDGFYVEWMYKSQYDALGGWPSDPYDPSLYYCIFDGNPTWHVGGADGYRLGPGESINVVLGELYDETGVTTDYLNELVQKQGVVVHAYTVGDASQGQSPFTADLFGATTASNNCTYTLGYWKTHGSAWPTFTTMMLGTVAYTKTQLLSILNKQANGNGLIILAHQLIAAQLNILNGADGSAVASFIADANNNLIGGLVVPPVGAGWLDPALTDADTNALDDFNNGLTGPGHCGTTPTRHSTWGEIKTLYR